DPVPLSPQGKGTRGEGEATVKCTKLEFLASTNNNTWGLGFSEEGILFGSTANGNPSVCCPIPNRYYEKVKGWSASVLPSISGDAPMHPITENVRQVDYHGRFTAAAGHALYTARLYPKEYWNRTAFVCEPTGHLVACFELTPDGASFRSRNAWNLVASDDEWASPIMAEVGPDSCVWILDWYNYIVQHNPTPAGFTTGKGAAYETPLRDKKHGRVYRLVPKDKPLPAKVNLKGAKPETLVETLKNDNMFWRMRAQRLLMEQNNKDLFYSNIPNVTAPLSTTESRKALQTLLSLSDSKSTLKDYSHHIIAILKDEVLMQDKWVSDALTMSGSNNSDLFMRALLSEKQPIHTNADVNIRRIATHIARSGDQNTVKWYLQLIPDSHPKIQIPILQAWAANWPNTPLKLDDDDKQNLTALIAKAPKEVRTQVIKLGMIWDAELTGKYAQQMKAELCEQLADSKIADENRLSIARDLIALMPSDDGV
ncbi:MAG TPA: glycosyl hydrolase, partial [Gemmatales bacterium]|nr:glycosyl hydrolase [Gemmatales bacterium]